MNTENGDKPAFPAKIHESERLNEYKLLGLTKREYFAAMAMQGLLSNLEGLRRMGFKDSEIPQFAIINAQELLKQLGE